MTRRADTSPTTLAVVDMGSNSFRLELGRVEGDQIFRLDTWRETLRMGAGLDDLGRITAPARRAALACLARFSERLAGLNPEAVRAVATNTFRVATNSAEFLAQAEATLGFPIDIGGGSTEFIIGRGLEPERLESLKIGCVSYARRFFPDGQLRADAFAAAEMHARAEVEAIAREFGREHWREAWASSGTALALAEILEQNGLSSGGITPQGLNRLRKRLIGAGNVRRLKLPGLKPERTPVLAGGFAIMAAALAELDVPRINPVGGAMRLGVLYDLLGRTVQKDIRAATVERLQERWRVDRPHAERVAAMAKALYSRSVARPLPESVRRVEWAGLLHEIGYTVAHLGFHKHGAYILENADMPGFSSQEQRRLALLVLGCRGGLSKMAPLLADADMRAQVLALRLAVLFHHARGPIAAPRIGLGVDKAIRWRVSPRWLKSHPLTLHLLDAERAEWRTLGYPWKDA